MPELPEVETTVRGLNKIIVNDTILAMQLYESRLRWPVDKTMVDRVTGTQIQTLQRRSKYLLLPLSIHDEICGQLMIHLGMSGRLQVVSSGCPREKHSHIDWILASGQILRYTDPRRFGSVHWLQPGEKHKLLENLGPEPLSRQFNELYLIKSCTNRTQPIKQLIMNAHIVVGVGNIYANEALYLANIHPLTPSGQITRSQAKSLVKAIKNTLKRAIKAGGTTLRDFKSSEGKPGYFQQQLHVYGRKGLPCRQCEKAIDCIRLGQRATYFCNTCQH